MMRNTKNKLGLLLVAVVLQCFLFSGGAAAKIKRVKAGKTYADHDAVHIVVNKVGCVLLRVCLLLRV